MPTQTRNRNTPRSFRTRVHARKSSKEHGRKGSNRKKQDNSTLLADTIHSITFKPKPGLEVIEKTNGSKSRRNNNDDDYQVMYQDLRLCLINAFKVVKNEETSFDPLSYGIGIGLSLNSLIEVFEKEILPTGYDFNVHHSDGDGYFFTIYKTCGFPASWYAFELGPVIEHLEVNDPELLETFLTFFKTFISMTEITPWWHGLEYAEMFMEERMANWDDHWEFDNEKDEQESQKEFQRWVDCLKSYEKGKIKQYENTLRKTSTLSLSELDLMLKRHNPRKKIVKWMKQGIQVLKAPGCVSDFIYDDYFYEEDMDGVRFENQLIVVWRADDPPCKVEEECLESMANGYGICDPVLNYSFTKHTKSFDLPDMKKREQWPELIEKLYQSYYKLSSSYSK